MIGQCSGLGWRGSDWDLGNPENRERTARCRAAFALCFLLGTRSASQGASQDEYGCLISPLMAKLHSGRSARQISGWLQQELNDHFGCP